MYKLRPESERGATLLNWLDSKHTFSFADYYDLANMGFSDLRVINDDIVQPQTGFGLHSHNNMEIISIVLEGSLEHSDSMGHKYILSKGEVQTMTAGDGIYHSEYNPSKTEEVHFLQIWILPDTRNLKPTYAQKAFSREKMTNKLMLVVSKDGKEGSLKIHQDAQIYQTILEESKSVEYKMKSNRKYWIQVAQGAIEVNSHVMQAGDGLAITSEEGALIISGLDKSSNIILFNLKD